MLLNRSKLALSCCLLLVCVVIGCQTHYKTATPAVNSTSGTGSVVQGRHLVMNMCAPCHYNNDTRALTGKKIEGLPRIAGRIWSSSLTNERDAAISQYTDAELAYLIRTGINRKGQFVPYMMRPNVADADLNDIIAFLRSADPILSSPTRDTTHKTHLSVAGKLGMRLTTRPQPFHSGIARPPADDTIALGRYLVDNMGCFHCHSASPTSLNYLFPETSKGYLAGGAKFFTPEGSIRGPNITSDEKTGIAAYTREDMRRVLQQGISRKGQHLKAPAEIFPVTDAESDAIYAYLRSYPARQHRVKGRS